MSAARWALGLVLLTGPALALEAPPRSTEDANMRVVPYNPNQRIRLIGTIGRAVNLTYSKHERVNHAIFGTPGFWEGPDEKDLKEGLKNNLALWPKMLGQSNMFVTTIDEKGEEHAYQYLLITRPASEGDDPEAVYGLTYTYATQEAAARAETARVAAPVWAAARAEARAKARLVADRAALPRNPRYTGQGNVSLAPVEISDDGQSTYFRFQGQQHVPAVFTVAPDGSEQSTMTSMDGETLVLHQVADELHLRLGASVLYVWNHAFNPIGVTPGTNQPANPGTGTSSPNVVREVRQAGGGG